MSEFIIVHCFTPGRFAVNVELYVRLVVITTVLGQCERESQWQKMGMIVYNNYSSVFTLCMIFSMGTFFTLLQPSSSATNYHAIKRGWDPPHLPVMDEQKDQSDSVSVSQLVNNCRRVDNNAVVTITTTPLSDCRAIVSALWFTSIEFECHRKGQWYLKSLKCLCEAFGCYSSPLESFSVSSRLIITASVWPPTNDIHLLDRVTGCADSLVIVGILDSVVWNNVTGSSSHAFYCNCSIAESLVGQTTCFSLAAAFSSCKSVISFSRPFLLY